MVQFAPIQTYQGPQLDILGSIRKGQEIRAASDERAQKGDVKDILSRLSDPKERQEALLAVGATEEAAKIQAMESARVGEQREVTAFEQEQQDRETEQDATAKEGLRQALGRSANLLKGLPSAIEGIEDTAQRERVWDTYVKGAMQQLQQDPEMMEVVGSMLGGNGATLDDYSPEGLEIVKQMADFAGRSSQSPTLKPEKLINVSAGASLYDPETGDTAYTAPAAPKAATEKDAERQSYIDRGISPEDADDLVYGNTQITTSDTGDSMIVNKATGETKPLKLTSPDGGTKGTALPLQDSLWGKTESAAGVLPAAKEAVSAITGQLGGVVASKTIEDRQIFRNATNELIRALSINPRFPVGEIERIKNEIKMEPKAFDSEKSLQARMKGIDKSLRVRLGNEERAAKDLNLPVTKRQAAMGSANEIRNFLNVMGVPQEAPPPKIIGNSDPAYQKLESGEKYIDPNGVERVKN